MSGKPTKLVVTCEKCKQSLPRDAFDVQLVRGKPMGVYSRCRACREQIKAERARGELFVLDSVVHIPLLHGLEALVDEADWPMVSGIHWMAYRAFRTWYVRGINPGEGKRHVELHRLLMGAGPDEIVDHENGSGLDNRRSNLRITDATGNARNQSALRGGTSRFKGVSWFKRTCKWRAAIDVAGRRVSLGYFADERDAARAYDDAAVEHYGAFAKTNAMLGLLDGDAA